MMGGHVRRRPESADDTDAWHRWLASRRWRLVSQCDPVALDRLVEARRAERLSAGRVRALFEPPIGRPKPVPAPRERTKREWRMLIRRMFRSDRRPLWQRALEARHGG